MAIYLHSYIKTPVSNKFPLPTDETHMLPFMASWPVLENLPLLVPSVIGAPPFIIQLSIVVWFFLPFAVEVV